MTNRPTPTERSAQVAGALRANLQRLRTESREAHTRATILRDTLAALIEVALDEGLPGSYVRQAQEALEDDAPNIHLVNINSPMFECAVDLALQELPPEDAEWRRTQFFERLKERRCP